MCIFRISAHYDDNLDQQVSRQTEERMNGNMSDKKASFYYNEKLNVKKKSCTCMICDYIVRFACVCSLSCQKNSSVC